MEKTALTIVRILKKHGFEAYWAGGCVRDMLMEIEPKDYDIVTSALPDQIEHVLAKTIPLGKQFGVIKAIVNKHHFEIATFRSDSDLSDGRRPDAVFFTNAEEDAKRRDFTINGLFYDPVEKEVIDYVGGREDLNRKVIRFIGDPDRRIKEDYLRILRGVRFKLNFGFTFASPTYHAIQQSAKFVTKSSWERIQTEINKMLSVPHKDLALHELDHSGILPHILPEVEQLKECIQPAEHHAEGDVYMHTLRCLHSLHRDTPLTVIWAVLLHDIGKPATQSRTEERIMFRGHEEESVKIAEQILDRFRFSKVEKEEILWLIDHHMMLTHFRDMRDAKRRRWFLHPWFEHLLQVMKADSVGTKPAKLDLYLELERLYESEKAIVLLAPPRPLLDGKEIMELFDLPAGPQIGEILEYLHDMQLEGRIKDREEAIELVTKKLA